MRENGNEDDKESNSKEGPSNTVHVIREDMILNDKIIMVCDLWNGPLDCFPFFETKGRSARAEQ